MILRFYCTAIKEFYPYSQVKFFRKRSKTLETIKTDQSTNQDNNLNNNKWRQIVRGTLKKSCQGDLSAQKIEKSAKDNEYYENILKIQMLSTNLHKQLFPQNERPISSANLDTAKSSKFKKQFQRHGINIESMERLKDVQLKLPPLKGNNIEEHFFAIGEEQLKPYRDLAMSLVELKNLPKRPIKWAYQKGWVVYDSKTQEYRALPYPLENGLILDVEVCLSEGPIPILAVAVGSENWYSWVNARLIKLNPEIKVKQKFPHYTLHDLIPLGKAESKLVVGHNVAYDRARLYEQYLLEDTRTRFLDTMSLHVCVSGVTSYQRALMKSKQEPASEDIEWLSQSSLNSLADVHRLYCGGEPVSKSERSVFVEGSLKDIRLDFQNLMNYCANDVKATHEILQRLFPLFSERFPHPVTLAGMLELGSAYLPINKNWQRFISHSDLAYEDLSIETKYHLAQRANEACALMKNDQYKNDLWLWDEDWSLQNLKLRRIKSRDNTESNQSIQTKISLDIKESLNNTNETAEDNRLVKKFQYLYDLKCELPKRRPVLPGYPAWYRKLCKNPYKDTQEWIPGPYEISTGMKIAPKLLSLCWEGYPLHYLREHGWGFLVPFRKQISEAESDGFNLPRVPIEELAKHCPQSEFMNTSASESESEYMMNMLRNTIDAKLGKREYYSKILKKKKDLSKDYYKGSGIWCNHILQDCCFFLKLPHKNGKKLRVGNPLSRDFINKFSENVLSSGESNDGTAARVIEIARMMSYWRNNRDRIIGQMVIWLSFDDLPLDCRSELTNYEYGAICPQVVVCGTLTRRAMEPTWMTASNSQKDRIGSELRAMVQAPPTYRLVGADVDSQELWIASLLGDSYAYRMHGCTPLGWMTLSGNKSKGTDMHSVTAKAVGISRDQAKVINYARIYGAGQNFAEDLLKQFNPTISSLEARKKATTMLIITKGRKYFSIKKQYKTEFEDRKYTGYEAFKLATSSNQSVEEMFERSYWSGGTESAMFNCLEEIAAQKHPVTPFLQCRLSRALETQNTSDASRFIPTRINWVVQSGAVDFLHLMLVSMRWLLNSKARFCLSFHDEIRYLVKEDYANQAALAMHITNLLTRAFCCSRLGLYDVPMSVAFFSSVEIDTVLRKESILDCKTPSNPHGLKIGYGIPFGESLNIYEAIEKVGSNDLTQWDWIK